MEAPINKPTVKSPLMFEAHNVLSRSIQVLAVNAQTAKTSHEALQFAQAALCLAQVAGTIYSLVP